MRLTLIWLRFSEAELIDEKVPFLQTAECIILPSVLSLTSTSRLMYSALQNIKAPIKRSVSGFQRRCGTKKPSYGPSAEEESCVCESYPQAKLSFHVANPHSS